MIDSTQVHFLIHYGVVSLIMALTACSVGLSQGIVSTHVQDAINRQPAARSDLAKYNLLALALIETASLLALILSMILLFKSISSYYSNLTMLAIGAALTIPASVIGYVSSFPARAGAMAIARQPFLSKQITNFTLLTLSLLQTPLIFGFIIAFVIYSKLDSITNISDVIRLISAGLCIGIGSIGPAVGVAKLVENSSKNMGLSAIAYPKIFSFTLLSQAIVESPVIFAAIISFWLILTPMEIPYLLFLAAAFVIAISTLGTSIGSSKVAQSACDQITLNPTAYSLLSRISLIVQAFIDTSVIYCFIIAVLILLRF